MESKDIVFITPASRAGHRMPPLGLGYMDSFLESKGFASDIIDVKKVWVEKSNTKLVEEIVKRVKNTNPEFIGFTCFTPEVPQVIDLAKKIKEELPDTKFIVGGSHATVKPNDFSNFFDYIVMGEGELTVLDILNNVEKNKILGIAWYNKDKLVVNPPRPFIENLDDLPFPSYEKLPMDFYTEPSYSLIRHVLISSTTIFTSRGCPYRCAFCTSRNTFGRKTRYRSAKNVVDEIELLVNKYGIDGFYVLDDTFTVSKKHATDICNEIKSRKLDLTWACETRVHLVNDEIIKILKNAGCIQIDFGVESGSQKILDNLQKDITVEQVKNAFKICHENKMRTFANFMINNPGETMGDIEKTRSLFKEIKPTNFGLFICTPYPETELIKKFNKELNIKDYGKLTFGDEYFSEPPIKAEAFKDINLAKLQRNLQNEFMKYTNKFNMHIPLKNIMKSKHKSKYISGGLMYRGLCLFKKFPMSFQRKIKKSYYKFIVK